MNENILSCTRTTLGLNCPCEIYRQPLQARPLSLKFFISPSMLRKDTKARSMDIKEHLQEDLSSTWFRLPETTSKLKRKLLLVKKMWFRPHSWVEYILKQSNLSVYLLSVCYYAFCTLNLHYKSSFELFSLLVLLKLICLDRKLTDHPYFTRSKVPADSFLRQSSDKGKTVMGNNNKEVSLTDVVVA